MTSDMAISAIEKPAMIDLSGLRTASGEPASTCGDSSQRSGRSALMSRVSGPCSGTSVSAHRDSRGEALTSWPDPNPDYALQTETGDQLPKPKETDMKIKTNVKAGPDTPGSPWVQTP